MGLVVELFAPRLLAWFVVGGAAGAVVGSFLGPDRTSLSDDGPGLRRHDRPDAGCVGGGLSINMVPTAPEAPSNNLGRSLE